MCSGDWCPGVWGIACFKNACLELEIYMGLRIYCVELSQWKLALYIYFYSSYKCRFALSRICLHSSSSCAASDVFARVFADERSIRISNHSFLQTQEKDSAWCKKWDWLCTCVLLLCWMKWQLFLLVGIRKDEMMFLCLWKDFQSFLLLLVPSLSAWNVTHRGDVLLSSFLISVTSVWW